MEVLIIMWSIKMALFVMPTYILVRYNQLTYVTRGHELVICALFDDMCNRRLNMHGRNKESRGVGERAER